MIKTKNIIQIIVVILIILAIIFLNRGKINPIANNINKEELRKKLRLLKASLIHKERLMRRINYDYQDSRLEKIGGWIRVRDEGDKITLAYKQLNDRTIHGTKEISIIVNNFEDTCSLLEAIGLKKKV